MFVNDSAGAVLGDEALRMIARELVQTVRLHVTIDWTVFETARANLRTMVKRLLCKYGYPPQKQSVATITVLQRRRVTIQGLGSVRRRSHFLNMSFQKF